MTSPPLVLALSIAAGVVPTVAYALAIQRLDRYEKEPLPLLAITFFWGAVPAILLAVVLERILGAPFDILNSPGAEVVSSGVIAPLVEELVKGAAILGLYLVYRHEFDDLLDGIIYGALVGLGFGLTENVVYFLRSHDEGGWVQWLLTVVVRTVIFGLVHSFYSGFVGAGFGRARSSTGGRARWRWPLAGLAAAILFHSMHNLLLSAAWSQPLRGLAVTALSDWAGILLLFVLVALSWRKEREWIAHNLADEIERGTLSQDEVNAFSAPRPMATAFWDIMTSEGWRRAMTLTRLYRRSVDLAFAKERVLREPGPRSEDILGELRDQVQMLRDELGLPNLPGMVCRHCGARLKPGQRYCTKCGHRAI